MGSRRPDQLGELTEVAGAGVGVGVGGGARRASPYRAAWVAGAAEGAEG